jgi:hypothetical protein
VNSNKTEYAAPLGLKMIWFLVLQRYRADGAPEMPHGFGKNDECGFLPKATAPGW